MKLSEVIRGALIVWPNHPHVGECRLSVKLGDVTWHRIILPIETLDDPERFALAVAQLYSVHEGDCVYHVAHGCDPGWVVRVEVLATGGVRCTVNWSGIHHEVDCAELHHA